MSKEDPKRVVPNTALLLRMLLRKRNRKKDESSKSKMEPRPRKFPETSIHPSPYGQKMSSSEDSMPAVGRGSLATMHTMHEDARCSAEIVRSRMERKEMKKSDKTLKKEKEKLKSKEEETACDPGYDPGVQSTKFEVVNLKGGVRPAHTKLRKRNIMVDGKSKFKEMELEMLREKLKKQEDEIRELRQETTQLKELNEKLSTKPSISQTDSGESLPIPRTERLATTAHSGLPSTFTAMPNAPKPPAPKKSNGDSSAKSGKDKKKPKDDDSVRLISSTYL